jgi:hypothetical protein
MSTDTHHQKSHEAFDELFRQGLKNHRIPVDEGGWRRIRRELRRRTALVWLGRAGMAAAGVAVLLFMLHRFGRTEKQLPERMTVQHGQSEASAIRQTPQFATGDTLQTVRELSPNHSPVITAGRPVAHVEAVLPEPANRTDSSVSIAGETAASDVLSDAEPANSSASTIMKQRVAPPKKSTRPPANNRPGKDRNRKQWLLSATVGLSGAGSVADNHEDLLYADVADGNGYVTKKSQSIVPLADMKYDDMSNIKHNIPFSLGFTVRKNLNNHFGLESGIMYSQLASRYRWSQYNVRQQLHYAGIPVNMVFSFGDDSRPLRFYLSAGGMAEKGIRAKYVQDEYWGNAIRTTSITTSIDGLQWSLNTSLGVKYSIDSHFRLYGAPYLSWYFDNGQPFSIRTKNPVFTGLHIGLNYEF